MKNDNNNNKTWSLKQEPMSGTLTFSVHAGLKGDTPDVREFPPEVSWNSQLSSRGAGGDRARSTRSQRFASAAGGADKHRAVATGACSQTNDERLRIFLIASAPHPKGGRGGNGACCKPPRAFLCKCYAICKSHNQ